MMTPAPPKADIEMLKSVGLPAKEVDGWVKSLPKRTTSFAADRKSFGAHWLAANRLLSRLPGKAKRTDRE
jgi:hypothetical protein